MAIVTCLGLDGSLRNFGLSVVEVDVNTSEMITAKVFLSQTQADKTKTIRKSSDDLACFRQHWKFINETITKYNCKVAIGEVPTGAQDSRAALAFGGTIGLLAALPIPLIQVNPTEVKLASTGHKNADKEDIIEWAAEKFPDAGWITSKRSNKMNIQIDGLYLTNANEHQSDAIAAVAAGVKTEQFAFLKSLS